MEKSNQKVKKILMLNYEFPPLGGGAGNATKYLLKEFSKDKNIEVDLITSSTGKYRKEKFADNINIYFLDIGKNGGFHNQSQKDLLKFSWKAYKFSKKLFQKTHYNLIHAFFSVPCGFIAMLLKKPFIVSLRGSDVPFYSEKYKWLDIFIFQWLNKIIWKKAQKVVANSSDLRDLAYGTYDKKKIEVIFNGVNREEFKPRSDKQKTLPSPPFTKGRELAFDSSLFSKGSSRPRLAEAEGLRGFSESFTILSTSRLTRRKGIIYLLKAVKNLAPKYPQIKLNLVGDGDQREEFENFVKKNQLEKNVFFKGIINHDKIIKEYQNSDVFVLPSFNEGMSNSLLEALASGLALISTDTGGAKDLIDKSNGFIISMKNSQEIQKSLEFLIKNSKKLRSMQASSRKKSQNFSWEKVGGEYLKKYKKLIEKE
jgi:glycosyltransferase involved in cell wall biosynthesis